MIDVVFVFILRFSFRDYLSRINMLKQPFGFEPACNILHPAQASLINL